MNLMPLPAHMQVSEAELIQKASTVWPVPHQENVALARSWAAENHIPGSASDDLKILLMVIDPQITFCTPPPWASLFVAGRGGNAAVEDSVRLAKFVYENTPRITDVVATMDTHRYVAIFHECFLINAADEHPAPGSLIPNEDIQNGVWTVPVDVVYAVCKEEKDKAKRDYMLANIAGVRGALNVHLKEYSEALSKKGRYPLIVWPYHAMLGDVAHALVPMLQEAFTWHAAARHTNAEYEIKGANIFFEMYSVLSAEITETSFTNVHENTEFIRQLFTNDIVIFAGQAASHCVAMTITDVLERIATGVAGDPELAKKMYILSDCMSPVVIPGPDGFDFTDMAEEALAEFSAQGMHVVQSTTPMDQWPGLEGKV